MFLTKKAWPPYAAGIVIGLLQIPALLIIETALGASSSYVTDGGLISYSPDTAGVFSYYAGTVPALALGFRTRLRRLLRRAWRQRATGCGGIAVGGLGAPEGTWE